MLTDIFILYPCTCYHYIYLYHLCHWLSLYFTRLFAFYVVLDTSCKNIGYPHTWRKRVAV